MQGLLVVEVAEAADGGLLAVGHILIGHHGGEKLGRHRGNKYFGLSMIFNFTNNGYKNNLAIHNIKWHIRTFIGIRL